MADKLQFELVSPEKLMLSESVGMVVVPGTEGNFGVLPGHALFISTVRPGVIDVYANWQTSQQITERIFVSGGFAEVTPERCTVLADDAVPVSSLDRASIDSEAKGLESTVTALKDQVGRLSGADRDEAAAKLRTAERHLAVATAKLTALSATAH